ncbi:Nitrogen assimilation transcription factor nit-4 [Psilocybe cubensis]|uniref:Zn(2)-C6 fungal-type domain-containing protein n=2 Tax=Psilocybe cubensis TaxID=181762 RepID=A0A8H7XR55_PSICU|nr:Nitrogen assimilation transcription factor nit-4 [Psilocybe cubensis]KAH9474420.1 Nitrogen assimilation transcription factor nit-4 [Psilocybe cubensis]
MKAGKSSGTGNPRGRGTYNPACDVCARKKTKCDGIKPVCQPCRQQGRQQECAWTKNPVRKPRTEQHFEALHKRAENLAVRNNEYRKYADYLESLLDECFQDYHSHRTIDFRASRPQETDLPSSSSTNLDHEFDVTVVGDEDNEHDSENGDPAKEICIPPQSLQIEEGRLIHHGRTSPFIFSSVDVPPQPSRFPALASNPDATYVLAVDGVNDEYCNPDFDWSRHLPTAVPLDRRSHDKALDLLFKFFTSWCFRIVPALFLRDMYRALSVPSSQPPPKTPHYSPMLHNALVALALAFLDDHRFRDLKARQYFANTAKSFIEAECQKPNLCVVHALSILASYHSSQGEQTLGYMYFGMSARTAQAQWVKLGLIDEADRLDRLWANWTTFSQDVCWSLYVGRDFCVTPPSEAEPGKDIALPFVDAEYDQMPWVHPPSGVDPQPNYLTKTFEATCELLLISRRIMDVINGLNRARSRPFAVDELISDIDLKLNTWRGSLAPELEITVKSRPTATPHKLMLHLAYWWLFILLHRPFFHRKSRPIYSTDREIDHVKLCRRAAENIMELLATWRSLYGLRYCPITLIQTVFSAGTVYLLTAIQAGSGVRVAQKELRHSLDQQKLVMQYLQEIGRSWQCATNIAGILNTLMHDQLKPLLERKTIAITSSAVGSLTVPEYNGDDDDDDPPSTLSRSSSNGHIRRHSSISKSRPRRLNHGRNHSASQAPHSDSTPPPSASPTITISPVHQSNSSATVSSPIAIQTPPKSSASPFSSSPSSIPVPDPWGLRPSSVSNGSPSPGSSPVFSNYSPSTFVHRAPPVHSFSQQQSTLSSQPNTEASLFYDNQTTNPSNHLFHGQGSVFAHTQDQSVTGGQSSSRSHQYPGKELAGFLGMLGGQTLPQAPFVGPFSLGDVTDPFGSFSSSSDSTAFSPDPASLTSFGMEFLTQMNASSSLNGQSTLDNDASMDDSSSWDFWAQTFES